MKSFILLIALALFSLANAQQYVGVAYLRPIDGSSVAGFVSFTVNNSNVTVSVNITGTGKTNTQVGIHVHQFGDLSGTTNGLSAGGHLNYNNQPHGCPETSGDTRHAGDMGNWDVDASGNIVGTKNLDLLTLTGADSIIGRAVVMHANVDDCINVPSAGARMAFGVIGVANVANNSASVQSDAITVAVCDIIATSDGPASLSGRVVFQQLSATELQVTASIQGINEAHGFHVHQFGDLSQTNGNSAGSHYNPENRPHSIPDNLERHSGDMGNILFWQSGVGYYQHEFTDQRISLNGVNSIVGRAVIVHELKDNCSQPVGFAGKRWGYCVIGVANATAVAAIPVPAETPSNQDTSACSAATTTDTNSNTNTNPTNTGSSSSVPDETSAAASIFVQVALLFVMAVVVIVNNH